MFNENYHIFIVMLLTFIILGVGFFLLTRHRKVELQLAFTELGTNVFVKAGLVGFDIQFERDGTVFRGSSSTTRNSTTFSLSFHLPQCNEKFLVRQNSLLAGFHAWMDEGQFSSAVSIPDMPSNCLVFSPNPDFTKTLLSNKAVLAEIKSLNTTFRYPQFWFEDGQFQLELFSGSGWDITKKFKCICRAVIVFHDSIKRLL